MSTGTDKPIERRRFSLGDGLILMIALAVSLERFRALRWFKSLPGTIVWFWESIGWLGGWSPWPYGGGTTVGQVPELLVGRVLTELLRAACPVLLGLSVAQPLLRLKRPRPPLEQVVRQPGFVSCLAAVLLACLLMTTGASWFSGWALTLPLTRGMILFTLWPLLLLPPWHAEAGWVDRLGRVVGWGWVVALVDGAVLERLGWL